MLALAGCTALLAVPAAAQTGAPAKGAPMKIVAFGDSLTAGYGLSAKDAFPASLERALKAKGHNVEIENAGVSGDTASGGLSRLDWSIADGTDAVIVELGANDMLRGVEPKVTRQALDDILAKLKARNIAVLLSGMRAAPNMGADYVRDFEAIFPRSREEIRRGVLPVLSGWRRGGSEACLARWRSSEWGGRADHCRRHCA